MKQRGEGTTFDFRALLEKQNRTRLAVVLGGAAMLLLLLSELLPATPPAEPSAASASQALVYREQLEAQLQDLIGQIDGPQQCWHNANLYPSAGIPGACRHRGKPAGQSVPQKARQSSLGYNRN